MVRGIYKHKSNQGFQKGHKIGVGNKYALGIKHTEKWKEKLKEKMTGKNNPLWRNGISFNRKEYILKRIEKLAGRKKSEQCEICGIPASDLKKGLCYDHNHDTGKFRGWLCNRCNVTLGNVKDNIELLTAMIEYIKKNK